MFEIEIVLENKIFFFRFLKKKILIFGIMNMSIVNIISSDLFQSFDNSARLR